MQRLWRLCNNLQPRCRTSNHFWFTAETLRRRGRVWLPEPSVLPASYRQLRLVCGRLDEASVPFSAADTLLQRERNVPTNRYGRDARPNACVRLPSAESAGARQIRAGTRASTPAETPPRLTPLHHRSHWSATSTPQKDLKPILVTGSYCGQERRAPRHNNSCTAKPTGPHRRCAATQRNFIALVRTHGPIRPHL